MRRRAVSEIIGAVIVITVVVAGLGIYTSLSQQRILGDTLSVKETIQQQDDRVSEMLEYVGMFVTNTDKISVFVHNFGLKNVTMSKLFVNGTMDMGESPRSFHVQNITGSVIFPNNKTLQVGKTSEIVLDFGIPITEGISNIVIKTDSDKIIQFTNNTN
ncbi:hypothetical protein [Nitrosopumilus ureiphilus]|uniref:Uncharacterized protein n=1 Tax=Nitrosopumilus ureiphilus TaxID=1470067 RepID=A0A7D5M4V0_9ARCH|nr:hypothetical protein [Nitrosopumilus ureiphilus]QLH07294.1 hypothetical protein C5F50_09565 [Nitrosopumilus ureiphilus]